MGWVRPGAVIGPRPGFRFKSMKPTKIIKLKSPVAVKGCQTLPVGQPFKAPASEAAVVIAMGAAEEVSEAELKDFLASQKAREFSTPETIRTPDPVVASRDPVAAPETPPGKSSKRTRAS